MSKAKDEYLKWFKTYDNVYPNSDKEHPALIYIVELEQEKVELIEILKPIKEIIDTYELYNELSIELIYDKLTDLLKTS